jgi:hypothetical protein
MNPSGTGDRARRSEAQTRGRLQGAKRYSNEKKILSSSPTTLHRPHLPALLAQWRKKVPGRMEHADVALMMIVTLSVLHPISFQLLWAKKCSDSACQSVLVIVILPPVLVNHSGSWYPEHSIVAASTFGS